MKSIQIYSPMTRPDLEILTGKTCPYCGSPSKLVDSIEIYGKSYGMIYLCRPCDAYVGCHRGSTIAKGRLADKELRQWKKAAHGFFDALWRRKMKRGYTKEQARSAAYRWLSEQMGIDFEYTHIGMFNIDQCRRVVDICKAYHSLHYQDAK